MLVGREPELDRVRALLRDARAGRGGGLVLTGPAGIGKSALLDAAEDEARDLTVIRISGVEAERDVPYAGLHAALSHLLDTALLGALPEPQARALGVALGLQDGAAPGRLALGAATLGVLAAQEGVLLLVDDLQWLDAPSADALCFAARRLVAEPVAVIATVRADGDLDPSSPASGLPVLHLSGLTDVADLLPGLHPGVVRVLADATAGNPLAILESAAGLTPEEAAGLVPLPRQLPPSHPERVYTLRLDAVSPATRIAGRVAALAGRAPATVLDRALAAQGLRIDDLVPLERLGLCRLGPVPTWRHPLARAAASRGDPTELRAAHASLAAAWGRGAGTSRAWHLAEAAEGTDREAAAALAGAAEEAERRDASSDAADAWDRAARLTEDGPERTRLLEAAGLAALRAGATRRASGLLDEALQSQPGPDAAARLLRQRGRIEHTLGHPDRALHLFLQSVDLASDRTTRVWAAAEGLYAAMYGGRPDQAHRMAELADRHHDPDDPVQRFLVVHARGAAAVLRDERGPARTAMDEARELLTSGLLALEPDLALWVANIELFDPVGQDVPADLLATVDRMREAGDLTWLPRVLRLIAVRHRAAGRWSEAQTWLEEAEIVSRMSGQVTQLAEALVQLAELDAVQGATERVRDRLDEAERLVADLGVAWLREAILWVRGLDLMTHGRDADAAALLAGMPLDSQTLPAAAELMLRSSGARSVRELLATRPPLADAAAGLAEAIMASDETAGAAALAASADDLGAPLEEALRRTWAGERYRRAGQRTLARAQLRRAHEVFSAIGATPWIRRVEDELQASGAVLRRHPDSSELTPSERRIAEMVAGGRSNKEVAAALYLSPKTVEFHLSRIYRKLEVANRTALARAMPETAT